MQDLSTRKFLGIIVTGASVITLLFVFGLFIWTGDIYLVLGGAVAAASFFLWGAIFLHYFQKKLSSFTDDLCRTLDEIMDNIARSQINYEAETLLAGISHRLGDFIR